MLKNDNFSNMFYNCSSLSDITPLENFEVSKGKSLQVREDYESKTIDFQFHLRLKTETAYLSAYVEIGRGYYEQCSSGMKPGGW